MTKYYFDSCVWRDYYENRTGPGGRPLGDYATKLIMKIIDNHDIILFSDAIIKELIKSFDREEIRKMMEILFSLNLLRKVPIYGSELPESIKIAAERNIPPADVLHAILARNNNAIMISQDKHYYKLRDVVDVKKPEELI